LNNNPNGFGAVQVSVNPFNNTQDFIPASSTFGTVFPTGFTDVPHIFINIGSFGGKNFAVDNIVVNTVPEPACALLILTALGMVLVRR
jgi:hypothetical protein